ncbi:MAG: prolyl oligopeptidase family serine peptidase [Candidatus Brocadiia bacterium]
MKRRRLIALAVICTICAVGVVLLPKLLAPDKTPFGPGPGAREPDIVVFESNAGNYITSCAYSGPFDDAVKIGQLQPAVVDKPATTATVWRAYVGDGASGNMMDLKDVLPFKEGQYFAFDFYIGVDQPRRCTLLIHGFGRMIVYIDDGKMLADQQTDEYGWAKFEAPGDFSDMPRRVSVILECKYTHCALKVGLLQGDKGAIPSTSTVLWPAGGKPTDLDLAGRAISVSAAQDGIVDAKEDAFIEVALGGGLPKGFDFSDMTVTADWGAGAQVENSFTRDEAVAGARFYIAAPATEATRLYAKVKIALNGNLAGTRSLQYYIPENYGRVITEVEKNAAGLDPKAKLPEVTLKLAQLRILAATKVFDLDKILRLEALLVSAGAMIGALKENRDPFKGMTGEIERAYISPADGSPQPYKVYLPEDFYITPRPRPLAVFLHGYVIEFTIAQWGEQMEEYVAGWHKTGAVVLQPFGRSNTDFQTIGEEDVIRTVDLVLAEYGCDPRKVYLEGVSMGGMGVWTIGAHYPDKFAAIVPMAGRTDYYYWHSIAADEYPNFKNLLVRSWNPMNLLPNYRYQNIIIGHGKSDRTV